MAGGINTIDIEHITAIDLLIINLRALKAHSGDHHGDIVDCLTDRALFILIIGAHFCRGTTEQPENFFYGELDHFCIHIRLFRRIQLLNRSAARLIDRCTGADNFLDHGYTTCYF